MVVGVTAAAARPGWRRFDVKRWRCRTQFQRRGGPIVAGGGRGSTATPRRYWVATSDGRAALGGTDSGGGWAWRGFGWGRVSGKMYYTSVAIL